jgi:hypothetical protein
MLTAVMYNNIRSLLEISTQHSSDRISETGRLATNVYMNFFVTSGLENSLLRQHPLFLKHPVFCNTDLHKLLLLHPKWNFCFNLHLKNNFYTCMFN